MESGDDLSLIHIFKINGENMKPILAKAAAEQENVTVLNHVNITDYKTYIL